MEMSQTELQKVKLIVNAVQGGVTVAEASLLLNLSGGLKAASHLRLFRAPALDVR